MEKLESKWPERVAKSKIKEMGRKQNAVVSYVLNSPNYKDVNLRMGYYSKVIQEGDFETLNLLELFLKNKLKKKFENVNLHFVKKNSQFAVGFGLVTKPGGIEPEVNKMLTIISKMLKEKAFSENDFRQLKGQLKLEFLQQNQTARLQMENFVSNRFDGFDDKMLKEYFSRLDKVSLELFYQRTRKYLSPKNFNLFLVGQVEQIKPHLKTWGPVKTLEF